MLNKDAARKVVGHLQEIQSKLDSISQIYREHGDEEDGTDYLATAEFVSGYLHQDIMHPLLVEYPDLAPENWGRDQSGQWMRQAGN